MIRVGPQELDAAWDNYLSAENRHKEAGEEASSSMLSSVTKAFNRFVRLCHFANANPAREVLKRSRVAQESEESEFAFKPDRNGEVAIGATIVSDQTVAGDNRVYAKFGPTGDGEGFTIKIGICNSGGNHVVNVVDVAGIEDSGSATVNMALHRAISANDLMAKILENTMHYVVDEDGNISSPGFAQRAEANVYSRSGCMVMTGAEYMEVYCE